MRSSLFVTTHWSVVLAARDESSPDRAQALETLCRTYWYPLFAFVRSSGYSPQDAQDLTQGFFASLLAKDHLRLVEPERGRFRTFLRMALKRFLGHEWERLCAQKRGGGQAILSFDTGQAEQRFQDERTRLLGPDEIYDRRWALSLLDEAAMRIERECNARGNAEEWHQLKPFLTAERGSICYADLASTLNLTEGAARVTMHRMRKRFREIFREVIGETVSGSDQIEEELRYVIQVLGRA